MAWILSMGPVNFQFSPKPPKGKRSGYCLTYEFNKSGVRYRVLVELGGVANPEMNSAIWLRGTGQSTGTSDGCIVIVGSSALPVNQNMGNDPDACFAQFAMS